VELRILFHIFKSQEMSSQNTTEDQGPSSYHKVHSIPLSLVEKRKNLLKRQDASNSYGYRMKTGQDANTIVVFCVSVERCSITEETNVDLKDDPHSDSSNGIWWWEPKAGSLLVDFCRNTVSNNDFFILGIGLSSDYTWRNYSCVNLLTQSLHGLQYIVQNKRHLTER